MQRSKNEQDTLRQNPTICFHFFSSYRQGQTSGANVPRITTSRIHQQHGFLMISFRCANTHAHARTHTDSQAD